MIINAAKHAFGTRNLRAYAVMEIQSIEPIFGV